MSGLLLAALLIIIPAVGALVGLLLSQLEDSVAAEGKTRDWMLFILIFLPTAIISIILLTYLRSSSSFSIAWLPGIEIGLHLSRSSIIFACIIANFSALIALYSISFMKFDRYRTQYWFFYQLTIAAMMMGVFSNNLFWLFGGFEVASIGAFFLISHWHRKTGEEGQKAGKAAIRYLIISICGDIFLLIGFGLILVAFNTSLLGELFNKWVAEPINILGKSSTSTRTIITFFLVLGALIKSAQIPILLWPLSGKSKDYDLAKSPITVAAFLVAVTAGNIGLFILSVFQPIFSTTMNEIGTGIPLFNSMPFILIGWFAILTLIVAIALMLTTDNINRIAISAAIAQLSFSFIGYSAGNSLGYASSIFHLVTSIPASLAVFVLMGIIIESIRIGDISRLGGLKNRYPSLFIVGIISILSYSGFFPFGTHFSLDMIFQALLISSIPSSKVILVITFICSVLLVLAITKPVMKLFNGKLEGDLSTRQLNRTSISVEFLAIGWAAVSGLLLILTGYPNPRFVSLLLDQNVSLGYDSPLFSNWIVSILYLVLGICVFITTMILYRDGKASMLDKIRNTKFVGSTRKFFANGMYLDNVYEVSVFQPINFLSRFFTWVRIKAPFASIIWAVLALALLVSIFAILGGGI
ncbi:MAG: hypothetical protein KGD59_08655 [Candidatus Heimdallarchaeota archaeon]|nr:hypothetical protein [Candidatus Heimdallarchaeota archaeon]MBY8994606.1 hypothetical protein [Candidatus Heimdallarchaeota archaeon]